jgi:hypothetical protein
MGHRGDHQTVFDFYAIVEGVALEQILTFHIEKSLF